MSLAAVQLFLDGEPIECRCKDIACPQIGLPGEPEGHIEDCPCQFCHHKMGKV
jgi:hypothetical protein